MPSTPGDLELVLRQIDGVASWHRQRRAQEASALAARTREDRLDRTRRTEVLREQHRAIVATTQAQLRASATLLAHTSAPRALLAHRNAWFTGKVREVLVAGGVTVVAELQNGAAAVGVGIAEQPDLVLIEDTLPMLPGDAVVRELLACAPGLLIGAQVAHDDGAPAMLSAGARAVWARRVPPVEVALSLLSLLRPVRL